MIKQIIKGKVVKGRGVGSQLVVPTANIELDPNYQIKESGVFAGEIIVDDKSYKAGIFIGPVLTFGLKETSIEVAIIDFSEDIYDKKVEVKIGEKIRDVKKFDSVEDLKKQILNDIEQIRMSS